MAHELIYTQDHHGANGRLHHLAFWVDTREECLRAADLFLDDGVDIEAAPSKHAIAQGFFLYAYEPAGNRIEVTTGGRLRLRPGRADRRLDARPSGRRARPGASRRSRASTRTARRPSSRSDRPQSTCSPSVACCRPGTRLPLLGPSPSVTAPAACWSAPPLTGVGQAASCRARVWLLIRADPAQAVHARVIPRSVGA